MGSGYGRNNGFIAKHIIAGFKIGNGHGLYVYFGFCWWKRIHVFETEKNYGSHKTRTIYSRVFCVWKCAAQIGFKWRVKFYRRIGNVPVINSLLHIGVYKRRCGRRIELSVQQCGQHKRNITRRFTISGKNKTKRQFFRKQKPASIVEAGFC